MVNSLIQFNILPTKQKTRIKQKTTEKDGSLCEETSAVHYDSVAVIPT